MLNLFWSGREDSNLRPLGPEPNGSEFASLILKALLALLAPQRGAPRDPGVIPSPGGRPMPVKLTDAIVARAKPVAGRRRVFCDAHIAGLRLRVTEKGAKSWAVAYRAGGRQRLSTLGSYPILGLAGAREAARQLLAKVELGADPAAERRAAASREVLWLGDLLKQYVEEWAKPRKRTWTFDAWVASHLGGLSIEPAETLRRRDLKLAHADITRDGKPVLANRWLEVIRAAYNWAIREEVLDCANPATMIRPNVERPRERVLTEGELRKLWAEWGQGEGEAVVASRFFGCSSSRARGSAKPRAWNGAKSRSTASSRPGRSQARRRRTGSSIASRSPTWRSTSSSGCAL